MAKGKNASISPQKGPNRPTLGGLKGNILRTGKNALRTHFMRSFATRTNFEKGHFYKSLSLNDLGASSHNTYYVNLEQKNWALCLATQGIERFFMPPRACRTALMDDLKAPIVLPIGAPQNGLIKAFYGLIGAFFKGAIA